MFPSGVNFLDFPQPHGQRFALREFELLFRLRFCFPSLRRFEDCFVGKHQPRDADVQRPFEQPPIEGQAEGRGPLVGQSVTEVLRASRAGSIARRGDRCRHHHRKDRGGRRRHAHRDRAPNDTQRRGHAVATGVGGRRRLDDHQRCAVRLLFRRRHRARSRGVLGLSFLGPGLARGRLPQGGRAQRFQGVAQRAFPRRPIRAGRAFNHRDASIGELPQALIGAQADFPGERGGGFGGAQLHDRRDPERVGADDRVGAGPGAGEQRRGAVDNGWRARLRRGVQRCQAQFAIPSVDRKLPRGFLGDRGAGEGTRGGEFFAALADRRLYGPAFEARRGRDGEHRWIGVPRHFPGLQGARFADAGDQTAGACRRPRAGQQRQPEHQRPDRDADYRPSPYAHAVTLSVGR